MSISARSTLMRYAHTVFFWDVAESLRLLAVRRIILCLVGALPAASAPKHELLLLAA